MSSASNRALLIAISPLSAVYQRNHRIHPSRTRNINITRRDQFPSRRSGPIRLAKTETPCIESTRSRLYGHAGRPLMKPETFLYRLALVVMLATSLTMAFRSSARAGGMEEAGGPRPRFPREKATTSLQKPDCSDPKLSPPDLAYSRLY